MVHMETSVRCLLFFILLVRVPSSTSASMEFPAMFVFGDSVLDAGNNNNLKTNAKANHFPYGIDFPAGATGRFCNGATIADYLAYLLGLDLIPAVNDPRTTGFRILRGVNFASGSSGILNDTGILGGITPLYKQVDDFRKKILPQLTLLSLNNTNIVDDFLAKSLFISDMGNNDYLRTFLTSAHKPIMTDFGDLLIKDYTIQLKRLYSYGARKFLILGLVPLGCLPRIVALRSRDINECYEPYNEVAAQFSGKIKSMVQELNKHLPGAYLVYFDLYTVMKQIIDHPSQYGFKYSHSACCGLGRANGFAVCSRRTYLCPNRSEYFYWDIYHQTDAANVHIVKQAYEGTMQSTYPMNVKQLLEL